MFELIRQKAKAFIWAIVILFVGSTFIMSASVLFFQNDKAERRPDALSTEDENEKKDELNLDSSKVMAEVQLRGQKAVITEGELNRQFLESDLYKRSGNLPPSFRRMFLPMFLNRLIDEKLLLLQAEAERVNVADEVNRRIERTYQNAGGKANFYASVRTTEEALRKEWTTKFKLQKMFEKMTEGRPVSDELVKDYYEAHKAEFTDKDGKPLPADEVKVRAEERLRSVVSEADVKAYYEEHKIRWRKAPTVDLEHLSIKPLTPERLEAQKVVDGDVLAYYESHRQDYLGPKKVHFAQIFVNPEDESFTQAAQPSEEILRKAYEEGREREFTIKAKVQVAHVFLRTGKTDENADALAKARARLVEERKRLASGTRFADLAREVSEDSATKDRGGLLPRFEEGHSRWGKAFEGAALSMKVGEVSAPVIGDEGVHLLHCLWREDGRVKTFDEVREKISQRIIAEKRDGLAEARAKEIKTQVANNFAELARKASQAPSGAKGGDLGILSLGENKGSAAVAEVGEYDFIAPAIQEALKKLAAGEVSPVVKGPKGYHILKLVRHIDAVPEPLEVVKKRIVAKLKRSQAMSEVKELLEKLRRDVEAKTTAFADAVAAHSEGADKEQKGLWTHVVLAEDVKPDLPDAVREETLCTQGLNRKVLQAVQGLREGEVTKPLSLGGATHLFRMKKRHPEEFAPLDSELEKEIRFALNPELDEEALKSYYEENKDAFQPKSKASFRHILMADEDGAKAVLAEAVKGTDFGVLARRHSMDDATRNKGGFVGALPPSGPFRTVLDKLAPGQVHDQLVRSGIGWHILKMEKKDEVGEVTFADVREQVQARLLPQKKEELVRSWLTELRNQAIITKTELDDEQGSPFASLGALGAGR